MLCLSTPKNAYLSKYGNCKNRSALPLKQVAIYARQILEALRFLHSKGLAFGKYFSSRIVFEIIIMRLIN